MSTDPRWDEIGQLVAEHKAELKKATSHEQLKAFAEVHGLMNKSDFGKFKYTLRKCGVDYEALRAEFFAAKDSEAAKELAQLGEDSPLVRLWCAAVVERKGGGFAIVGEDREVLWYGSFFDGDRIYQPGDAVSGEQSVADKGVWLARKAFDAAEVTEGRVELVTTCPDLDTDALVATAARMHMALSVIVDDDVRAVEWAEENGFKSWRDNSDLSELVEQT